MQTFNPTNWFWFVGGDQTKAFSSAVGDYVPLTAPALVAWMTDGNGNVPTTMNSEADLGTVLAPYLLRPVHPAVLDGYTASMAAGVAGHVAFKLLFNLMKRVAVLEGKAAPTAAQALAFAKALM